MDRPILFSGPMVRALLAGTKTQTRRVVKLRGELPEFFGARQTVDEFDPAQWGYYVADGMPWGGDGHLVLARGHNGTDHATVSLACPFGEPGDTLWVRETWAHDGESLEAVRLANDSIGGASNGPYYRADGHEDSGLRWRPSIHMPRWASRITLRVTDVRVQRVRAISERDAQAEGAAKESGIGGMSYVNGFHRLWDSINDARGYGWDVDPFVWCVSFERVTP